MNVISIPVDKIDSVWILVKKYIDDALLYSGGHNDSDFVHKMLKENKMQLWVIWDDSKKTIEENLNGVVVTEIIQRKYTKACNIYILTGKNRQKWQHLVSVIEDFAKQNNCNIMELIARPGWQKILKNYNYKRTHIVLEKIINKQ
jgi:hypothetical protein